MKPEWILPVVNPSEISFLSKKTGINDIIISVLYSRGIKTEEEIYKFMFPELNNLHSPFLLDSIYEAIERLKSAISKGEKIAIFGDSDLDGITSMTIVYGILEKAGCKPVIRYPKAKESYGLTCAIIDEFIINKVKLVITVDSGIRDIEEISYGRDNGLDFIITDHHEPGEIYPDAIIINPKKRECNYPYKELAGVGVAFKLIQAFLYSYTSGFNVNYILIYKSQDIYLLKSIKNGIENKNIQCGNDDIISVISSEISDDDYIVLLNDESYKLTELLKSIHKNIIINDFKKIASTVNGQVYECNNTMINKLVSDYKIYSANRLDEYKLYIKLFIELHWRSMIKIMSILQEYIVLVTIGTIADVMPLTGENRLLVKYGLFQINKGEGHAGILSLAGNSKVTTRMVSWEIAPLLNAPGRMGETQLTVNFFMEKDNLRMDDIISSIHKINKDRKKTVTEIIEKIKKDENIKKFNDNIIFYMDDEIIDGIAGLIANRLSDYFNKPVIIATGVDNNGHIKGSARSSGNFNFFSFTNHVSHLFERIGGHAQAFGFTAEFKNIDNIVESINRAVGCENITEKKIQIDSLIDIDQITKIYIKNILLLEPFGKKNDEPVFAAKNVKIESFSSFGSKGNHGKYIIKNSLQVIGWNMYEDMEKYFKSGLNLDLVFKLENNEFRGMIYPRIVLIDLDFSV